MFPSKYFAPRYFPTRYFPPVSVAEILVIVCTFIKETVNKTFTKDKTDREFTL